MYSVTFKTNIVKLWVFFIGADNVIFERLRADQADLKAQTQDHLDVSTIAFKLFLLQLFWGNFSI